jgi:hypothetical protein
MVGIVRIRSESRGWHAPRESGIMDRSPDHETPRRRANKTHPPVAAPPLRCPDESGKSSGLI